MKTSDFDYQLPPGLISQTPAEPRDHCRLMVLDRVRGSIAHRHFYDIVDYLRAGDVLVFNDSRVIPARLRGRVAGQQGRVEILLLHQVEEGLWECLARPAKKLTPGTRVEILSPQDSLPPLEADVMAEKEEGVRLIRFSNHSAWEKFGTIPLPPYIRLPLQEPEDYQTVYARVPGSAAAPTAGLHFTRELLDSIRGKGISMVFVTVHIGLDTFRPVRAEEPHLHPIHREYAELGPEAAAVLNQARSQGGRIICVGTSCVRVVEQAARAPGVGPFRGWAGLYILPGHTFRAVDGLATNFHLPRTTLLMLVCAFAGKGLIDRAYAEAMARGYRFYSFGDAMLIL